MKNKESFNSVVEHVMQEKGLTAMRPVVEKEILHYEIFSALYKHNLLDSLVFQGGTSLRLCRGSNRFSEDIDFAGGTNFSAETQSKLSYVVQRHIGDKFGLFVTVKEPKKKASIDAGKISVDKWQVSVETSPDRSDIPRQRIKIEVANIPAHTSELAVIKNNYTSLDGYDGLMVNAETIEEVMADKLLALPVCVSHIRHRDIWDLAWLAQQGAEVNGDLVSKKVNDYHVGEENYLALLGARIDSIPEIVHGDEFLNQMKRFISSDVLANTLLKPGFNDYLIKTTQELLTKTKQQFDGPTHSFSM
jgi:predicted nucleotidyltransferase component of viral defense system